MTETDFEITVHDTEGEKLSSFPSISLALKHARQYHQTVWKMEFDLPTGEHVSLIRKVSGGPFLLDDADIGIARRTAYQFSVQSRSHSEDLGDHASLTRAMTTAKRDCDVWKISFPLPTRERVRLVRNDAESPFFLEQMEDAIEAIRAGIRGQAS